MKIFTLVIVFLLLSSICSAGSILEGDKKLLKKYSANLSKEYCICSYYITIATVAMIREQSENAKAMEQMQKDALQMAKQLARISMNESKVNKHIEDTTLKTIRTLGKIRESSSLKDFQARFNEKMKYCGKIMTDSEIPLKVEEFTNKGNYYYDKGQIKKAIKAYNEALELNDNLPTVWSDLGVMLHKDGQLQKAIDAFENATRYDPYFLNAYLNMGIVLLNDLDNKEKAFQIFNIILEQNPEFTLPNNKKLSDYMKQ